MAGSEFEKLVTVSAGFPSPANDYLEPDLDYNSFLKRNPSSTFSMRVDGESMIDSCIPHESIIVVDRSLKPVNNSVVVVTLDGERIIKHLVRTKDGIFLLPANKKYKAIKVEEGMDFTIWGTVTHAIIEVFKKK